ncbi:COX15/CtaA family protein [Brevibacterium rongguiense]|nr:COX15/CtaA family protein [Brevibacterium rongguiense]
MSTQQPTAPHDHDDQNDRGARPQRGARGRRRPAKAAQQARTERRWQPSTVTPVVRALAWAMLIAQALIVVTGALVRLTGSGLGCPDWPTCDGVSITNTPDMGIHGFIEFGNRLLGVVLGLICLATVIMLLRLIAARWDLFLISLALTLVVPVQAVIGGISVHMELNPWIVAAHFVPSAVCVALSAYFVRRTYDAGGPRTPIGTPALRGLAWTIAVLTVIIVIMGVLTTGAGPHAGDEVSARNGLPIVLMARLHAAPVWLLVIATVAGIVAAHRQRLPEVRRPLVVLLIVELAQGVVGYIQYFTGLPVWLVALHMAGLCVVIAASTAVLDSVYRRAPLPPADTLLAPRGRTDLPPEAAAEADAGGSAAAGAESDPTAESGPTAEPGPAGAAQPGADTGAAHGTGAGRGTAPGAGG